MGEQFFENISGQSEHVGGGKWEKVPPYPWLLISRLQPVLRRRNVRKNEMGQTLSPPTKSHLAASLRINDNRLYY